MMANGNWSATITPIGVSGGAVVANAMKNGDGPSLQQIVQPPQGVFMESYHQKEHYYDRWPIFRASR